MVITRINYWFRILAPLLFCPSPSKRGKKVDALWVGDCHGAQVENVFFSSTWLCFFPTPRAKQPWWGLKREHCVSSQWPYVLERLGEGDVHSAELPRRHCCKFHLISGALFHRAHAGGCLWRCREGGNTAHAHFEVSVFDNTPRDRMRLIYSLGKQGFSGYGFLPSLRTICFYVLTIDCSGRTHNVMNLCVNV